MMTTPRRIGAVLLLVVLSVAARTASAQSNLGLHFCVAFLSPEDRVECDDSLMLFFTAPRTTQATITLPSGQVVRLNVPARRMVSYACPCIPVGPDNVPPRSHNGVFVDAQDSIALNVHVVAMEEGDAYGALPIDQWGTDYRMASARGTVRGAVIAASNNTRLDVYTANGGMSATYMLQRGDVQVLEEGRAIELLLHASQPVAALGSGWERNASPIRYTDSSALIEQLPAISEWGMEFISMPFEDFPDSLNVRSRQSYLHVSAHNNGTTVTIDGAQWQIDSGRYLELPVTGYHHIVASNPVLVTTWRASTLDDDADDPLGGPRLAIVPSMSQHLRDVWFTSSDFFFKPEYRHFITIVHPAGSTADVRLDGAPLAATWRPIAGTSYVGARLQVLRGAHHLESSACFGVMVYGADSASRNWRGNDRFDYDGYAYVPGLGSQARLSGDTVVIDSVMAGTSRDTTVTITNAGSRPVTIDSLVMAQCAPCPFTILTPPGFIIPPGGSHTVRVRYAPTQNDSTVLTLYAVSNVTCNAFATAVVIAHANMLPMMHLCAAPAMQAAQGDTMHVHLELVDPMPAAMDSVQCDLVYDQTVMWLSDVSSVCPYTWRVIAPGRIRCNAVLCKTQTPLELIDATFLALVSKNDTARAAVTVDSITFFPRFATGASCPSVVTITPACGLHGIGYSGGFAMSAAFPNPSDGRTAITLTLPADRFAPVSLELFDSYGRNVREAAAALPPAASGVVIVTFDLATLPCGIYTAVLESGGARVVRRIHVVR